MLETRLRRAGGVGDRDEPNRCIASPLYNTKGQHGRRQCAGLSFPPPPKCYMAKCYNVNAASGRGERWPGKLRLWVPAQKLTDPSLTIPGLELRAQEGP